MSALLNIGLTGLNASQAYLNTTSHNIANAATPGFHRQSVTQEARDPQYFGGSFFGTGTGVTGVKRSYNELLETQVLNADSRRAEYAAYNRFISQVDNVLADADTGLTPALNEFFGALQSVSSNPTNIAARQALLSSGETLVARFQTLDARIGEIADGVHTDMAASMVSINGYASAIAELNQRIMVSQVSGAGSAANDLLDQRGQAISELNKLVKVSTVPQRDGSLSVFIGSGQALVLGNDAKQLSIGEMLDENGRQMIMITGTNGKGAPLAESFLNGGELGGLLAVRREGLEPAQRSLGLLAASLATAFNEQHQLGIDLDGALGDPFFSVGGAKLVPPTSGVQVLIDPAKLAGLTGADYELRNDAGKFNLTDIATGKTVELNAGNGFSHAGLKFDNLDAVTLPPGQPVFVYPTRFAAASLQVKIDNPRNVATAAPVLASLPQTNAGSARITELRMTSVEGMGKADGTLDMPATSVSFTEAAGVFTLQAAAGYTLVGSATYSPANDGAGKIFTLRNNDGFTFEFKLSGTPAVIAGVSDRIDFTANSEGVADNRNAALLGALQTDKLMFGADNGVTPSATLNNAYAQLVAQVGSKTREVQAGERTQTSLLAQATAARDAVAGVNLDEEAANLVRFQQSYQAAGRVMAVAQRLFDEMLAIGR